MIHTFVGVADAHGVESFKNLDDCTNSDLMVLSMRASLNRQRHAVMYTVQLSTENGAQVVEYLNEKNYKGALLHIQHNAVKVIFPEGKETYYMNSWKLIPLDELDPYWSK